MDYLTPLLSFLGGSVALAVVNSVLNRGRSKVELGGIKDDQTTEWRDNALHLSEQLIDKDKEVMAALRAASNAEIARDALSLKLDNCLERTEKCTCRS